MSSKSDFQKTINAIKSGKSSTQSTKTASSSGIEKEKAAFADLTSNLKNKVSSNPTFRSDALKAEMDEVYRKREEASKKRQNYTGRGSWLMYSDPVIAHAMNLQASEDADAEFQRYDAEYNRLRTELYNIENQTSVNSIRGNADVAEQYTDAKTAREDMKKLFHSYLPTTGLNADQVTFGYQNHDAQLQQIQNREELWKKYGAYEPIGVAARISAAERQSVSNLEDAGYNFDRISDYEQRLIDAENRKKERKENLQLAYNNPVVASAIRIGAAPFQGLDYLSVAGQTIANDLRGEEDWRPVNTDKLQLTHFVTDVQGEIGQNIEENTDWMIGNQNVARFLYDTGMSMSDSLVSIIATGGVGTSVLLGGAAASQTALQTLENGGTEEQAVLTGLTAGAAEYIFEKVGIDNLLSHKNVRNMKHFVTETLKQGGIEATEEVLTEISNIFTNAIIMGQNSDFNKTVEFYMSIEGGNLSEEDAKKQAILNCISQVAWAGAGGFLSGVVMGGAYNGANLYNSIKEASDAYGDNPSALIKETLENNPDDKYAMELQKRLSEKKNVSGYQLSKLAAKNEENIVNNDVDAIQTAVADRLTELGETGDISEISSAIAKKVANRKLTGAERKALSGSRYGVRVSNEIDPENIWSGEYSSDWAQNIGTKRINPISYGLKKNAPKQLTASEVIEKASALQQAETPATNVSETGKTVLTTGDEVEVEAISSVGNGKMTVRLTDGRTVSGDSVLHATADEAIVFRTVSEIATTPGNANTIMQGFKNSGMSASAYTRGVRLAHLYGKLGNPIGNLRNSTAWNLSEAVRMAAYKSGQKAGGREVAKAQAEVRSGKKTAVKTGIQMLDGTGKAQNLREYLQANGKTLSAKQEAGLVNAEILNEAYGVSFYFYESYVNSNGKRVWVNESGQEELAPNGFYRQGGVIYVDLNAGAKGDGLVLFTQAHELTHFIKEWSPAKFEVLKNAVFKQLEAKGYSVEKLIANQIAKAKRAGRGVLSPEDAAEEVVADAMEGILADGKVMQSVMNDIKAQDQSLWDKIVSWLKDAIDKLKNLVKAYDGAKPDSVEGRAIAEMKGAIGTLEQLYADALKDAGESFKSASTEVTTDVVAVEETTMYSYSSLAEAAGFEAEEYEDGTRAYTRNGEKVSEVTVDDIENSPIGALINFSLDMNDITAEEAEAQKKLFADICTLACQTNDFAMTMQFVGSAVFTGIKANADKQYGTTYDFPSICTKTQAVIDAMSAKMVALERGLTTEEIKELYNEVHHMGNPVPCPECYVFSRWIGIGGLLDNIKHYQDVYGDMNPEEVAVRYREMHVEVEASAIELGISFGKAKGALANKYTKEFNKLTEKVEKQQNQGENVTREDLDKLADLESMMDTVKAMTWIEKVYFADSAMKKVNPRFRVPSEVLFDLGNGEAFASVYKEAWAFRTTQGAGYGKAITPYAEARLGEGILGTNSITNTVKKKATGELNNPYLKQKGKLDKDTRKKLIDARAKQKNQAFIGGQRFQSTSDARFENASDYLLATLEMQAMHGMVQDYTKVDGAVPAFSAWGFSTNQSLMPKDGGLDANGNITDSTVGGMLPSIAFDNRKKFESAGTITIGVNDAHIRKMFGDVNRDFIIPYHASGGKADVVAAFRAIQEGDLLTKTPVRSTDYSRTQSDKVLSDEVLRWMGKSDAEIQHIHDVRAARIAILTRAKPNMSVVRGNRFLSALYDKLNGGEWDGVKLAKGKVESQIFPNEFWDQSVTYEESAKITRDYLEYCEDLGFLHRFSGKVPKNGMLISVKGYDQFGNRVTLTDLAYKVDENGNQTDEVEDFFWKVLTDRRMYDNSGNYLPQKVVSLNTTTKDTVTNFAKFNHGRQYNKELSKQFTDKIKADADVLKMSNRDAELADNFVNHMKGILNTRRSWYAKDVINYVQEHPELNFIDRIYVKDKTVKTDLKKFLDNIDNLETLDYLSWYMGQAYSNPNTRGAVRTFRNAIKKRMNDIKTAQVGGTNLGIKNGEVTLSEIRELYHKLNTNEDMVEFADKVFDTVERLGINIRFVNQTFAKNVSGNVMGDMLEYKTSYFNDTAVADQRKAQTILHEMLHVCTSYVLFGNTTMGDVSSNQYSDNWDCISNAATRLNRIYNQIQYDPEFRGQYGITNVHEMVAELANPEFVGLMKKKSLWESIVDWICELFGYTRGDSAYDNAKMCVDYILDNPEVKAYKDYANDIRSRARWQYDTFGETKYSDRDVEKISPIEIAPINGIEDRAKFDYLVSEFKHNGWNGRPIVVVENGNNGYIALTGSHRILAASEADIDVEAIVLDYTEELDELINAYTDDERASIAEELRDEGLLSDDVYRLIAREENLNWENSGVPYDQQIRYSDRVLMGSLFSGGGTLEAGLVYQMVDKEFAVEKDAKIASVYTDNHGKEHMFVGDVQDFDSKKKDNVFYLHASPSCKDYSVAKKNGGETTLDILTAEATARVLEEQMPPVFTLENVKQYRGSEAYKLITNKLDELGYSWDVDVYNSAHYGAATARERLIIRAVKDGALPAKPKKTGFTTWYDAVADLIDELPEAPMPNWMRERYDAGNYRTDMPLFILGGNKSTGLSTAYADKPAPTLLASSHDARIVMPDGRVLKATPRAMARIQGLPDNYKLPKQTTRAYTVIGNGIPTQLTKAVMGGVLDHAYEQTHGKVLYSDRETAPVFYSQMAKVIDGVKQEKLGAASVVSMLRGKGVKAEEIKWSGIEDFLAGKKSVTKQELQEFVAGSMLEIKEQGRGFSNDAKVQALKSELQDILGYDYDEKIVNEALTGDMQSRIALEDTLEELEFDGEIDEDQRNGILDALNELRNNDRPTKWHDYKLDGGKNYRELLFKMPGSYYINDAMQTHWNGEAGVLAHARIQDFDTDSGRMLFVEEIQSDWHNEGHKSGYVSPEFLEADRISDELFNDYQKKRIAFSKYTRSDEFTADSEDVRKKKFDKLRGEMDEAATKWREADERVAEMRRNGAGTVPNAPFKDTYHEFVMKRLLRMAAEGGYDSIGWTTADIQVDRWSDIYAEGYRIEYDQDIPKFLRKYGKKWGAEVGRSALPGLKSTSTFYDVNRWETFESFTEWQEVVRSNLRSQGAPMRDVTFKKEGNDWICYNKKTLDEYDRATENKTSDTVWSMPITDSMRESVLYEGQPMYSERDPLTDQEVLKRAAEGLAIDDLTDAERDALKLFKKRMNRLEGLQAQRKKLDEDYRRERFTKEGDKDKAEEIHKMMTQTDRQIDKARDDVLKVEQAEVLRRVLHDARKLVEAEERKRVYAREKEKFDKREAKIRKEYADRREAVRENTKDRKLKAELRMKIRKTVRELDKLLTKGTKERNVKEDLKELVTSTLKSAEILFTDELTDDDLLRNGIETQMTDKEKEHLAEALKLFNKLQSFYKDPSVYNNLEDVKKDENRLAYRKSQLKDVFVRERSRLNEAKVSDVLNELADAYAKLQESDVSYINDSYNEVVHQYILWTKQRIGGTLIKDMNSDQLADLNKIYTMVKTIVRDANKMFAKDMKETKEQLANRAMFEVRQAGGEHGMWTKAGAALSTFGWNNLKPIYAVERLGSTTLVRLFKNIRKGEDVWKVNIDEADAFRRAIQKKYNFDSWDNDKQFKFTAASGIEFSLSLEQMMSLYAYSKREQAHAHLLKGGFVFDKNTEVVVNKNGIKVTYLNKNAKAHSLDFDILSEIISKLTAEQIAYVDEMQEYLSTTMGNKGNEVSMQLYGVKMFGEKYYFPLRSAGQYMARAKETDLKKEQGQVNLINSAFTKMTVYNASNPVVLSNFSDVWNDHVNEMSMYNAFVLPLEDFRKVWNYSTPNMEGGESISVNSVIQNAYGDAAVAYFDQLIKDLNGGALSDNRENIAKRLTGLFKKSAVFASLSVVIQQPMSVVRAFAEIDPKYFVGDKMNASRHKETWAELKKYAPVAGIKEMGYFDTGMGMSARDFLSAKEYKDIKDKAKALVTDSNYRDELLGKAPALADEIAWCLIWSAVKRETKANNPKMSIKSEEFLQMCGDRFTDIVTRTQVYDSVLARSANMRSKSALMTMATSFGAEPTTVANMVDSAVQKLKKGDKQGATRQLASVLGSIVLTGAAVSLVYAMRDDDEDETFLEKYMQSFAVEVVDGMNPMTYLPFVRDVWSILQGYDVERADMSLIADVVSSMQNIVKLMSKDTSNMSEEALDGHKKQLFEAYWGAADYLFAMFGLPVKNIRRDIKGAFNVVKVIGEDLSGRDTTWGSLVDKTWDSVKRTLPVIGWTPAETTQDKLYKAIMSGDKVYANRLKGAYKNQSAVDSAIRKALRTNDPRIKEAAIAWNAGKHSEYMKIAKSIIAEKNFSQDNIVKAIMAEADALAPDESTITNKVTHVGLFNMDGFSSAIAQGNTAMADTMKADIIDTAIKNGKTRDEAESNFATSVRSEVKELYLANEIKEPRAYEVLTSYGKMTEQDAENTLRAYNWMKNNPRYDLTVSQALSYTKVIDNVGESPEDSGISPDVFVEYLNLQSKCKGFDNDSDGKADRNSKKNQILEVIDNLPITSYQKDVLYFMNGWARSNLRKAPWH